MKKYLLILLSLILITGYTTPAIQETNYQQISMDEAIVMMEKEIILF